MSTLKTLKDYLIGENGYLIDDNNNGKTVMLSGAWGAGKTHFWLKKIKPKLTKEKKKNIYISLYGMESMSELKYEVLKEAYNLEVKEDFISKSASMLSTIAPSFGEKSLVDGFNKLNKKAKDKKAKEILQSGSIICLDDFERKSKNLDLNDLFGYISQLALEFECKVVIILNSDVFEGEETKVFKTVKEKTVNKFFHFEPTIEELFKSIQSNKKYRELNEYKTEILNAIKETEELNARIYIQVLDNCLEWIGESYDSGALRTLVLNTVCFVQHHFILNYPIPIDMREANTNHINEGVAYNELRSSSDISSYIIRRFLKEDLDSKILIQNKIDSFYDEIVSHFSTIAMPAEERKIILDEIDESYDYFMTIIKFGYKMYVAKDIEESIYRQISSFIKTGILLKKDEEKEK